MAHHKSEKSGQYVQSREMGYFNQLAVDADVDVKIVNQKRKKNLVIYSDPREANYVYTKVKNGKLFVDVEHGHPRFGKMKIVVYTPYINYLNYEGSGNVHGNIDTGLLDVDVDSTGSLNLSGKIGLRKLHAAGKGYTSIRGIDTRDLAISMKGNPTVQLSGKAKISSLDYDGEGRMAFYWVDSQNLKIRGHGQAYVQLAGIVDRLDVELFDSSKFNGKYLRAKRGFVKTHDESLAEITILNKQHTVAMDNSNIYFYNAAKMGADFMGFNGSVLDFREAYHFATNNHHGYRRETH